MRLAFKRLHLSRQISFLSGFNTALSSFQNTSSFNSISSRAFSSHFDFLNDENYNTISAKNLRSRQDIYVGNLPYDTTESEIRKHFEQFGRLTRFSLLSGPDGSFRGKVFITYDNPESTKLALKENSQLFKGRVIEVSLDADRSKEKAKIEKISKSDDCTIFIRNLPFSVGAELLKEKFEKFGKILGIDIDSLERQDLPPGIAFITYQSAEMAKAAQENMNGKELESRAISVTLKQRKDKLNENRVYVKNLPGSITTEAIKTHFGHCGEIESIDIRDHGVGYALIKFKNSQGLNNALKMNDQEIDGVRIYVSDCGRKSFEDKNNSASPRDLTYSNPKDFGEASYASVPLFQNEKASDISENASTTNQNLYSSCSNKIIGSDEEEKQFSVFLSNLPPNVSKNDLKALFKSCGEVDNIIVSCSLNKLPKSSGIIKFYDQVGAENARKLGNIDYNGCNIKIQKRTPNSSKGFDIRVKFLPRDATEDEIKQIFGDCGTITRLHFPTDRFGNKIDVCFVGFESLEQAQAAIKKDKLIYKNFPLEVKLFTDENREIGSVFERRDSLSILVGNIPFHGIDEKDIKDFFSQCGKIVNVHLVRRENGKVLGYGFVEFSSQEEVQKAINLEDKTLLGRTLRISQKRSSSIKN
ncbi:unnamed protein product [Blepharisma stoltei]|uniref:RRM domain-containing protein n=1 Tax=Blepharisma stoltei TaxID=1481888 RepID=A0AAU9ILI0_9CILI|nr:unnamed protein product [Blepharisma stoltei]